MGRLQASSPMSFWENFRSPGVDMWSLFVGGDSKPPQQKQGVHPLNPPASLGKHKIHETYRTTQMLLPCAVLHALLYLSYLCLLIPIRDIRAEPTLTLTQFNLSTIIFAFPSMYGLAHPLICLTRHFYLRQRVDDLLSAILQRNPPITLDPATDDDGLGVHVTPELSSIHSFRSEHDRRVDFHVGPEQHAQILATFWGREEMVQQRAPI
ncbi:hypothetical protein RB195_006890 [Necator americanus]|uniref:G-protein coupled receptors family 1 profile domain-containing protein n=1 Tax=Necator americanus TaxID=51031 RepID=A0ABR1BUP6_NECAM